jgi:hypothetical protein
MDLWIHGSRLDHLSGISKIELPERRCEVGKQSNFNRRRTVKLPCMKDGPANRELFLFFYN